MRVSASNTPTRCAYLRDRERAGLDIVTDGDARFDTDVGGMSWFRVPARRLAGLAGGDYRTRKGYGGAAKGDIIFEVMESRVMPRCTEGSRARCAPCPTLEGQAQGIDRPAREVAHHYAELIGTSSRKRLLRHTGGIAARHQLGDARGMFELADTGCAIVQMETNIHLVGVQRGASALLGVEFFVEIFQQHGERAARPHRGVVSHLLGNPAQERLFATNR